MESTGFSDISPAAFVLAVAVAALLAMGVFHHASKHGSRHPTAWGIGTFLLAGFVIPFYFTRYWLLRRQRDGR